VLEKNHVPGMFFEKNCDFYVKSQDPGRYNPVAPAIFVRSTSSREIHPERT
jgi:hypothetical protein